jgi:hypothetical protein
LGVSELKMIKENENATNSKNRELTGPHFITGYIV